MECYLPSGRLHHRGRSCPHRSCLAPGSTGRFLCLCCHFRAGWRLLSGSPAVEDKEAGDALVSHCNGAVRFFHLCETRPLNSTCHFCSNVDAGQLQGGVHHQGRPGTKQGVEQGAQDSGRTPTSKSCLQTWRRRDIRRTTTRGRRAPGDAKSKAAPKDNPEKEKNTRIKKREDEREEDEEEITPGKRAPLEAKLAQVRERTVGDGKHSARVHEVPSGSEGAGNSGEEEDS